MSIEYTNRRRRRKTKPPKGKRRADWMKVERALAEQRKMDQPLGPAAIAQENLDRLNKPRKSPPRTWIAWEADTCGKCFLPIEVGQRIHRTRDGVLVHHSHRQVERVEVVCDRCFMTKPCECDE